MILEVTDDLVRSVLPNVLVTVDEEIPIAARIEPYVKDSIRWIETTVVGDFELPEHLQELAARAVVLHACAKAIPALDIVVTPTGLGVVSADGLVPASKERIERLIKSLAESASNDQIDLQFQCLKCEDWRDTAIGKWYCSTFFSSLLDAMPLIKEGQDVHQVYMHARATAALFEDGLERDYFGTELMQYLRADLYGNRQHFLVLDLLHNGVCRFVAQNLNSRKFGCPSEHPLWHFAESIIPHIMEDKKLRKIWKDSMGKKFDVEQFKNDRKGGYFF